MREQPSWVYIAEPAKLEERGRRIADLEAEKGSGGEYKYAHLCGYVRGDILDAALQERGRLLGIVRVNGLRAGFTHAEIDAVLYGADAKWPAPDLFAHPQKG